MHPVRVCVETTDASIEYLVHVRNHSRHALTGAVRSGWRRYPAARSVIAEFTEHDCATCARTHTVAPVRRVFKRTTRRAS
jgi:hypothetical protein